MTEKMILDLNAKLRKYENLMKDPAESPVDAALHALVYEEAREAAHAARLSTFCSHVRTNEDERRFTDGYAANALRKRGRDMRALLLLGYALGIRDERMKNKANGRNCAAAMR